ncbi:hypothetical protein A9Q97_05805 [Rhodospirillales bacterium 47_12_T64]|nr:hypothetical protein A9Q97_05805 [Rhodospirillales bacterium 47_12_T64]
MIAQQALEERNIRNLLIRFVPDYGHGDVSAVDMKRVIEPDIITRKEALSNCDLPGWLIHLIS